MRIGLSPAASRRLTYLGVAGIAFQVGHFAEHLAQFVYWIIHPTATPWLSPWAVTLRDALSNDPAFGVELLHLVGNAVFLGGLLALLSVPTLSDPARATLRMSAGLQAVHVAEHVLLTVTRALSGSAFGLSTAFGALSGSQLSSYRVLWHFVVNLVVTVYAVRGIARSLRGGLVEELAAANG